MTPTARRTRRQALAREALAELQREADRLHRRILRYRVESPATYEAARIEVEQRKEAGHV